MLVIPFLTHRTTIQIESVESKQGFISALNLMEGFDYSDSVNEEKLTLNKPLIKTDQAYFQVDETIISMKPDIYYSNVRIYNESILTTEDYIINLGNSSFIEYSGQVNIVIYDRESLEILQTIKLPPSSDYQVKIVDDYLVIAYFQKYFANLQGMSRTNGIDLPTYKINNEVHQVAYDDIYHSNQNESHYYLNILTLDLKSNLKSVTAKSFITVRNLWSRNFHAYADHLLETGNLAITDEGIYYVENNYQYNRSLINVDHQFYWENEGYSILYHIPFTNNKVPDFTRAQHRVNPYLSFKLYANGENLVQVAYDKLYSYDQQLKRLDAIKHPIPLTDFIPIYWWIDLRDNLLSIEGTLYDVEDPNDLKFIQYRDWVEREVFPITKDDYILVGFNREDDNIERIYLLNKNNPTISEERQIIGEDQFWFAIDTTNKKLGFFNQNRYEIYDFSSLNKLEKITSIPITEDEKISLAKIKDDKLYLFINNQFRTHNLESLEK
jgi:hypothetical protein